tara:strand:+ start:761 stop:1822 length:1062 start_codon:yes stop_codon:yes gene_type:complete
LDYKNKTAKLIATIIKNAKSLNRETAFAIASTTKKEAQVYFTPIRDDGVVIIAGVIVFDENEAKEIAKIIDGRIKYIFVDSEKKIKKRNSKHLANIERIVKENIKKSKLFTYKANDLTVEALDMLITRVYDKDKRGVGGKNIAVIGCGNIGFKISLKLLERGANVLINRRNENVIKLFKKTLNTVKPKSTKAKIQGSTNKLKISEKADVIIGLSSGSPTISESMIKKINTSAIVIDAGKGTLTQEAIKRVLKRKLQFYRLDVNLAFKSMIYKNLLEYKEAIPILGKRKFFNEVIVSGGVFALNNEIVVDNYKNPKYIYGISNGRGDFYRSLDKEQIKRIKILKENIDKYTDKI